MDPITRLSKDMKDAAIILKDEEARFLVDYYYMMQKDRIRANNQIRSMAEDEEPHELLVWLSENTAVLERNIKSALQVYAESTPTGKWALSNHGIGPVITAGLSAHIDIEKATSPSCVWSFAGLNPTAVWRKGEKRPWNAKLKTLCWHIGESFKRTHSSEKSFYGPLYAKRKALEVERNDAGENAEAAAETLKAKKIGKSTDAFKHYTAGKLPPARLDLRACRFATKIFLVHFWQVLYEDTFKKPAPSPWIIAHGGHVDMIEVPNYTPLSKKKKSA